MKSSEQEMTRWLAHPMEFGQPPAEIKEIHRERTAWPLFDKPVTLAFHRYRMPDGFSSIGMTGPITWSFLGDDLSGFNRVEAAVRGMVHLVYGGQCVQLFPDAPERGTSRARGAAAGSARRFSRRGRLFELWRAGVLCAQGATRGRGARHRDGRGNPDRVQSQIPLPAAAAAVLFSGDVVL